MAEEKKKKKGLSTGAWVAISCGGCLGLVILFIVIISVAIGGGKSTSTNKQSGGTNTTATAEKKEEEQKSDIGFSEFDDKFGSSSSNTDIQKKEQWKDFQGKRVSWKCEVTEVSSKTKISFKCNSDTWTSDTRLSFDKDEPKLLEIKKGDNISFSGVLKSYGMFGYELDKGILE